MRPFALALTLLALVPASASAGEYDLPPLVGVAEGDCLAAPPTARAAQGINVRATITRYERRNVITAADADSFRATYDDALRARRRLSGQRRNELSAVIGQLE
ncbi:MAG TPA: hypothetical protein VF587_05520, partial [Solirubrobacteraceae bacterium]